MKKLFIGLVTGLLYVSACSTVRGTGEAVDSVGQGVGEAVSGTARGIGQAGSAIGHGASEAVSGAGRAVEHAAGSTERKGY